MTPSTRYREMISPAEFDRRVSLTKLTPASIETGRSYLVGGLSIKETAKTHGTTPENVRRIVARICRGC